MTDQEFIAFCTNIDAEHQSFVDKVEDELLGWTRMFVDLELLRIRQL